MASNYIDDLIDDDEIPELTEKDVAQSLPFTALPPQDQARLRSVKHASLRPDAVKKPVSITLAPDLAERLASTGEGWESKVDEVLRDWLETHKAS